MFLYARLVLRHIRDQTTWEEIQEAATTLPAGLDEA